MLPPHALVAAVICGLFVLIHIIVILVVILSCPAQESPVLQDLYNQDCITLNRSLCTKWTELQYCETTDTYVLTQKYHAELSPWFVYLSDCDLRELVRHEQNHEIG